MAERLVNEEDEVRRVLLAPNREVPISCQSVVLEDGSRVSSLVGKEGDLLDNYKGVRTMYEAFQRGVQLSGGDGPCLGTRTGRLGLPKFACQFLQSRLTPIFRTD